MFDRVGRRQKSFTEVQVLPDTYLRSILRPGIQLPPKMMDNRRRFIVVRREVNEYERKLYIDNLLTLCILPGGVT